MTAHVFAPPASPYLVPFDETFRVAEAPTAPPEGALGKKACKKALRAVQDELVSLQRVLQAHGDLSVLMVFQAMDAAGKDGTIRAVMSGINPAGCEVHAFKKPSKTELAHDYLWRVHRRAPERGRIGIFNRSHYEDVLVVRVHPEYLSNGQNPHALPLEQLWAERYESIRDLEKHLARNGTVILKFWLNVSRDEQRDRFLSRIDEQEKNWKFNPGDIVERGLWDDYMRAYEHALNATSRPWAPWYAIPADDKPFMRLKVAEILRDCLANLPLAYPEVSDAAREEMQSLRDVLARE